MDTTDTFLIEELESRFEMEAVVPSTGLTADASSMCKSSCTL